jgi:hypothetical protein
MPSGWFTIPKMLRIYFLHHRELLGALSLAAYPTVKELMAAAVGRLRGSGSRCRMWTRQRPRSSSDTRCSLFSAERGLLLHRRLGSPRRNNGNNLISGT